ncbi:MAG: hypothetical protein Q8M40_02570 [Legionella sp.]|nr:hypothetical protein [Legionella sp.]
MLLISHHFLKAVGTRINQSDENWLPYFASKATGDVIMNFAGQHTEIQFLVLCGHTHTAISVALSDNLMVKSGKAEYYKPEIQELIFI